MKQTCLGVLVAIAMTFSIENVRAQDANGAFSLIHRDKSDHTNASLEFMRTKFMPAHMTYNSYMLFIAGVMNWDIENAGFVLENDGFYHKRGDANSVLADIQLPVMTAENVTYMWKNLTTVRKDAYADTLRTYGVTSDGTLVPRPRMQKSWEEFLCVDMADFPGLENAKAKGWHLIVTLASCWCGNPISGAFVHIMPPPRGGSADAPQLPTPVPQGTEQGGNTYVNNTYYNNDAGYGAVQNQGYGYGGAAIQVGLMIDGAYGQSYVPQGAMCYSSVNSGISCGGGYQQNVGCGRPQSYQGCSKPQQVWHDDVRPVKPVRPVRPVRPVDPPKPVVGNSNVHVPPQLNTVANSNDHVNPGGTGNGGNNGDPRLNPDAPPAVPVTGRGSAQTPGSNGGPQLNGQASRTANPGNQYGNGRNAAVAQNPGYELSNRAMPRQQSPGQRGNALAQANQGMNGRNAAVAENPGYRLSRNAQPMPQRTDRQTVGTPNNGYTPNRGYQQPNNGYTQRGGQPQSNAQRGNNQYGNASRGYTQPNNGAGNRAYGRPQGSPYANGGANRGSGAYGNTMRGSGQPMATRNFGGGGVSRGGGGGRSFSGGGARSFGGGGAVARSSGGGRSFGGGGGVSRGGGGGRR